ncbi:MAG: hypothetical protein LBQ34_01225 [Alphaproteobacteria bacterium]|jgi:isoprenylcysteine carboxyl methyltransferase (ICMT) family protein YpbQ|nr:hypothetical protein [Alphaproteobacteria bacterium]
MQLYIIISLFVITVIIRLIALKVSRKNEKALIKEGAIEYGQKTTKLIVVVHTLAYFAFFAQGVINATATENFFDGVFYVGIAIYLFSIASLIVVIRSLHRFWTVKIYVSPNHVMVKNFLFKYIKHPNYYFNIIPEIIALAIINKAWMSLTIILPIYVILLFVRIKQEEKALLDLRK